MSYRRKCNNIRPPHSYVEFKGMKFLITDQPCDYGLSEYVQDLKKKNVRVLVRVCETDYETERFQAEGIEVRDVCYEDGQAPPQDVIDEWFDILKQNHEENQDACVAVHCVTGLGRAPLLVALALIELGLSPEEAIQMVREKRRGAFNALQKNFIEQYSPQSKLKPVIPSTDTCTVL